METARYETFRKDAARRAVALLAMMTIALSGCATTFGRGETATACCRFSSPASIPASGTSWRPTSTMPEWATEVERARRTARAPFEPTWTMISDHSYPSALYGPYHGGFPAAP